MKERKLTGKQAAARGAFAVGLALSPVAIGACAGTSAQAVESGSTGAPTLRSITPMPSPTVYGGGVIGTPDPGLRPITPMPSPVGFEDRPPAIGTPDPGLRPITPMPSPVGFEG